MKTPVETVPGRVGPHSFSWLRVGPPGPVSAVFLHANGFPPSVYAPFLGALGERMTVMAMPMRPLWAPWEPTFRWADLGWDLLDAMDHAGLDRVIVVGHSLGATASIPVITAKPDRFRGLVMVEPAMVHRWQSSVLRWLPGAWALRFEPAKGAARRRDHWDNPDAYLETCRRCGIYDGMDAAGLNALAQGALVQSERGVKLAFPKLWEARILTTAYWPGPTLRNLHLPVVGIRGASSMFLDDTKWRGCTHVISNGWYRQLPEYGHLLPLEAPQAAAAAVLEGIEAQGLFQDTHVNPHSSLPKER